MTAALTRPQVNRLAGTVLEIDRALRSGSLGVIRWDEFALTEMIDRGGGAVELSGAELTRLITDLQSTGFGKLSRRDCSDAAHLVAKDHPFDSAKDWLKTLPLWDRVPRIERFMPDYIGTQDRLYERTVGIYLWTAQVSRILIPGCKADMVPVIVGDQGVGKSTMLTVIAPTPTHCGEACLTDRSSQLASKIVGKTMLIWEEMRGIKGKCDADEVKTFITSPYIEVRRTARAGMERADRRFIIIATSDRREILADPAGERRFLPFEVPRKIAIDPIRADKLQLWAEAYWTVKDRLFRGEDPVDFIDAEMLAKAEHKNFLKQGRWVGEPKLLTWLGTYTRPFSAEEALNALGIPVGQRTQREKREIGSTLRQLGYETRSTRVPGLPNPVQRWHRAETSDPVSSHP